MDENKAGRRSFSPCARANRAQQIEKVGKELRKMMTFLKKRKEAGVPQDQPVTARAGQ